MRKLTLALLLMGCNADIPVTHSVKPNDFEKQTVFCQYDMQMPYQMAGKQYGYFSENVDCVPPEGGNDFSLGFGFNHEGFFRFHIDRPLDFNKVYAPDRMQAVIGSKGCYEWTGEILVQSDLPKWSVFVDVVCAYDSSIVITGQFSGGHY